MSKIHQKYLYQKTSAIVNNMRSVVLDIPQIKILISYQLPKLKQNIWPLIHLLTNIELKPYENYIFNMHVYFSIKKDFDIFYRVFIVDY